MQEESKINLSLIASVGIALKTHLAVYANENPIEFINGYYINHDVKVESDLIDGLDLEQTEIICANKGYDSEFLIKKIKNTQSKVDIPKNLILNPIIKI